MTTHLRHPVGGSKSQAQLRCTIPCFFLLWGHLPVPSMFEKTPTLATGGVRPTLSSFLFVAAMSRSFSRSRASLLLPQRRQ